MIQLKAVEELLIIILAVLLFTVLVILIIIVYKSSQQKEQDDHQLWHDFIILESPDQVVALKNSQSLSIDTTVQHQMLYNHSIINKYNNTNTVSETTFVPQSPPPVYQHHTTTTNINK